MQVVIQFMKQVEETVTKQFQINFLCLLLAYQAYIYGIFEGMSGNPPMVII